MTGQGDAAVSGPNERECCGHIHTEDGCTGEPTPSDLWAGVTPSACDCEGGS